MAYIIWIWVADSPIVIVCLAAIGGLILWKIAKTIVQSIPLLG